MPDDTRMSKPPTYGDWWRTNEKGLEWYEEIFETRRHVHAQFLRWMEQKREEGIEIDSVLEVGCGRAVMYADHFRDLRYVGYDISAKEIEWCRQNRANPRHAYVAGDIIEDGLDERFDLVYSHAVIDHIYDVDRFLEALVACSRGWIYVTAYRGWFPDLADHVYSWSEEHRCFYNDVSARKLRAKLESLGCAAVEVRPLPTQKTEIVEETVVTAHVPERG